MIVHRPPQDLERHVGIMLPRDSTGGSNDREDRKLPSIRDLFGIGSEDDLDALIAPSDRTAVPGHKAPQLVFPPSTRPFSLAELHRTLPAETSLPSSHRLSPPDSPVSSRVSSSSGVPSARSELLSPNSASSSSWTPSQSPSWPPTLPPLSSALYPPSSARSLSQAHPSRPAVPEGNRNRSFSEATPRVDGPPLLATYPPLEHDASHRRRHTISRTDNVLPSHSPHYSHYSPHHNPQQLHSFYPGSPPAAAQPTFAVLRPSASGTSLTLASASSTSTGILKHPHVPPNQLGETGQEDDSKNLAAKYECPYCAKRFNRPSSLKIHVNTHTGAKPYQCPFPNCGRRFSVMSNMRRHSRVHAHGKLEENELPAGPEDEDLPSPSQSSTSSSHSASIQHSLSIPRAVLTPSSPSTPTLHAYEAGPSRSSSVSSRRRSRSRSSSPEEDGPLEKRSRYQWGR